MSIVTVIIPTYNSESAISDSLNSILNQRLTDWDILVIDGLSADNTLSIVASYAGKDKRIKYISEKDRGIYDAMNKGLQLAKGEWLYFLGSDDMLYDENVLQEAFSFPGIKDHNVLYGNVRINGDSSWSGGAMVYDGSFNLEKLFKKNICHQGIFYRRSFIHEKIGLYNIRYKICADWDFNLRCRAQTDFLYLDMIIAFFSAGGESSNGNADAAFMSDFFKNVLSYFHLSAFSKALTGFRSSHGTEMADSQKKENYFKFILQRVGRKLLNQ